MTIEVIKANGTNFYFKEIRTRIPEFNEVKSLDDLNVKVLLLESEMGQALTLRGAKFLK